MAAIGTGATVTFDSGFFAEIISANWNGIERPSIDTTHTGTTTARTFVPGSLYDPGELEVEIAWAAETEPPYGGAAETCTLQVPSSGTGGTSTWAASGFMINFSGSVPLEERQTATGTIKLTGAITVTP